MKNRTHTELVIFKHGREKVKLKGDFDPETLWASQAEIAVVFGVDQSVVTKHIRNILKDRELDEMATCAKFAQVQKEGNRFVECQYDSV